MEARIMGFVYLRTDRNRLIHPGQGEQRMPDILIAFPNNYLRCFAAVVFSQAKIQDVLIRNFILLIHLLHGSVLVQVLLI